MTPVISPPNARSGVAPNVRTFQMLVVPVWPPTATAAPVGLNSRLRHRSFGRLLHTPGRARRREEPQPAVDRPERESSLRRRGHRSREGGSGQSCGAASICIGKLHLAVHIHGQDPQRMHEELRRTQGAAALALGRYRLSLPHHLGTTCQICARDRLPSTTTRRRPSGLNAASMTPPVSFPKRRDHAGAGVPDDGAAGRVCAGDEAAAGLQGAHPAAWPHGQVAGLGIADAALAQLDDPSPCGCSRSRAAHRGRRGRRVSSD